MMLFAPLQVIWTKIILSPFLDIPCLTLFFLRANQKMSKKWSPNGGRKSNFMFCFDLDAFWATRAPHKAPGNFQEHFYMSSTRLGNNFDSLPDTQTEQIKEKYSKKKMSEKQAARATNGNSFHNEAD